MWLIEYLDNKREDSMSKEIEYELNESGFHKLTCPACQSPLIETIGYRGQSQCEPVSPSYDPNLKYCSYCDYMWKQEPE